MKNLLVTLSLFCAVISNAQSLVSITPSTGAAGSTVNVVIVGSGTSFTNNTRFSLTQGLTNIIQLTNVVATSATRATASVVIPSTAVSGAYALSAIVGLGLPLQLSNAFTVTGGGRVASIESIEPDQGDQGQFLSVTITGINTKFNQASNITATLVKGLTNTIQVSAFAMSDTTLMGSFFIPPNAEPGMYNLVVNAGTNILNKANAFEVMEVDQGEILEVTPNEGEKGETFDVTIKCSRTKFLSNTGSISVEFYDGLNTSFEGRNIRVINDTTLRARITLDNTMRSGKYDLFISTMNGFLEASEMFTIIADPNEPRLKSISPNFGNPGQKLDITVSGVNTAFKQSSGIMLAIFNQSTFVEASSFSATNDSTIIASFEIPSNFTIGTYDFGYASDEEGVLYLEQAFSLVATSVKELIDEIAQLFIYPNPVENELYFNTEEMVKSVTITDITGKQIVIPIEEVKETTANTYSIVLDKYAVSKGIHFLRVETTDGVKYQKFLTQ